MKHGDINFRGLHKQHRQKVISRKTKLQTTKWTMGTKTAKNLSICSSLLKKLLNVESHALNAAHDQKIPSLSRTLFTMTAFLTFAFRSQCRMKFFL